MLHPIPLQRHEGHAVVRFKGLSCGYDKQEVLSDVSLDIMEGDFIGLLGPSGSGKTTTAGKLALRLRGSGRRPLLVAADLQRAAAVELQKWTGASAAGV